MKTTDLIYFINLHLNNKKEIINKGTLSPYSIVRKVTIPK